MALPTTYTEFALASYMLATLGEVAGMLSVGELELSEAVNDALLAYGASNIAQATDIPRLRMAARVAAWRTALAHASTLYQFSADGATYNRQQMVEHIRAMLQLEESNAAAMGVGTGGVWATTLTLRMDDPYRVAVDDAAEGVD
jgi:hypothetical protein